MKAENERLFKVNLETITESPVYKLSKQLEVENEALKSRIEKLRAALLCLNNEVAAMIATHGDVISADYGKTNLDCLEYRLYLARAALKADEVGG